jgi:hypothetical protein
MPLEEHDRKTVIGLLRLRLAREGQPREWLAAQIDADEFLVPLKHTDEAAIYARNAVDLALKKGGGYEPPWIVALLQGLPRTAQVEGLIAKALEPAPELPDNPFATHRLHTGSPFLNRSDLRAALQQRLLPASKSVLVVNGPEQSGKSYTRSFIEYVCRLPGEHLPGDQEPPFRHAPIDLDPEDAPTYGAEALAADLVSGMECPSTPPPPGGDVRERELERWVFDQAAATNMRWWWVLDGFANDDLPKGTRTLLNRLLLRVRDGTAARRVRIALLDYTRPLRDEIATNAEFEVLGDPGTIDELYVADYLGRFYGDTKEEKTKLKKRVRSVLDDLPAGTRRLGELRIRLEEATSELEGAQG